jgi:uncharacterized protein involved in cysteine biosynthesis
MENQKRTLQPERNSKTHAQHRREVFWQITLPLVIGILLFLAALGAIIFSATQPVSELRRWADTSLVWIILPSLLFAFIMLVIFAGLVYGLSRILRAIPSIAYKIQQFIERSGDQIARLADMMAEPVLRVHTFLAITQRLARFTRNSAKKQNFSE